jgi:hypothetical protein
MPDTQSTGETGARVLPPLFTRRYNQRPGENGNSLKCERESYRPALSKAPCSSMRKACQVRPQKEAVVSARWYRHLSTVLSFVCSFLFFRLFSFSR